MSRSSRPSQSTSSWPAGRNLARIITGANLPRILSLQNARLFVMLLFPLALIFAGPAPGQENLGFEAANSDGRPIGWQVSGNASVDNRVSYQGAHSLRMSRTAGAKARHRSMTVAGQSIDAAQFNGGMIEMSAAIRTEGVADGYAGLWLRIDNRDGTSTLQNMSDRPVTGTTHWTKFRLLAVLPPDAKRIVFGALLPGTGTAWFDDFSVDAFDAAKLPPPPMKITKYVTQTLNIMEAHSIRRRLIDWKKLRATTLRSIRGTQSISEAYPAIQAAVKSLGDNHSQFIPPVMAARLASADPGMPWQEPEGELIEGRIGYLLLPAYIGGNPKRISRYANEVQRTVREVDSRSVCGWVVDLRENTGGNVFPMLAGVGPILGEGPAGGGVRADGSKFSNVYRDGQVRQGKSPVLAGVAEPYELVNRSPPVAVLIGPHTASSGEQVAISFIGRPKTRLFGTPSAGLTTGNDGYRLPDGAVLNLASARMMDRNGRTYSGRIQPNVIVSESNEQLPIEDQLAVRAAVGWLKDTYSCR